MRRSDVVPGLRVSLVKEGGPVMPDAMADSAARAAAIARAFVPAGEEREHFIAIYVDSRSRVKGVSVVSIGTLSASLVHPREVFRPAIVAGAAAVIVAHNHPSGDCTPSAEDRDATRRLIRSGELLGVPLLDHVVLGEGDKFASFRELGLLLQ